MINTTRLQELRDEVGEDDLAEVIELFCEEMTDALDSLATTEQDQLPGKLHFLKGSALNIGLDSVSDLCRMEETRIKSDPSASPDAAAIRQAYDKAIAALKAST